MSISTTSTTTSFQEKPQQLPLISHVDGKFQVDKKSVEIISKIKEPIAVLSIAGVYRSGKSFLLNQILDRNDGFSISPTVMPCTKGLWVWSVPLKVSNKNHSDFRLLIIDSEGIGSFCANETYDTQIFALSLLLSSFFIYNSVGSIDDNAITRLGLVTELSKYIRSKLRSDVNSLFPSFLWVVRDFTLDLNVEGRRISSKEYLENALAVEDRIVSETERAKQQIKTSLKHYFTDRDCFTLLRPIHDERKLQNASKVDVNDIRFEFRQQIEILKEKIFSNIKPKEFSGKMLNGRMFISLCENYCNAMNEGSIVIDSCWNNVVKHECDTLQAEALRIYKSKMQKLVKQCVDQNELENAHFEYEQEAMNHFVENSKTVMGDVHVHLTALQESIASIFKLVREESKSLNFEMNSQVVVSTFSEIISNIDTFRSIDDVNYSLRNAIENFSERSKGDKNHVLVEFFMRWMFETLPYYHNKTLNTLIEEKNSEVSQLRVECDERLESIQQQLNNEISNLMDAKNKLREQLLNLNNVAKRLKKEISIKDGTIQEQGEEIKNSRLEQGRLSQEIQQLERQVEILRSESKEMKVKYEDQIHAERMENDALKEENINLQNTLKLLQENKQDLQHSIYELQEVISKLKDSYQKARQQNLNAEETLKQTSELLSSTLDHKKFLEEANRKYQDDITRLNNELESQREIIRRQEREISNKNAKLKSSERLMAFEKEKAAESEDRLRQTLKNSAQLSSIGRVKELEEQVEQLNITNRRILDINKAVMEENKQIKEKLREKKLQESNLVIGEDATNSGTPERTSLEKKQSMSTAKTPDIQSLNAFDTPKSITDVSPITPGFSSSTAESEDSVNMSSNSNNSEEQQVEEREETPHPQHQQSSSSSKKTLRRRNSPVKQTRTPTPSSGDLISSVRPSMKTNPSPLPLTSSRRRSLSDSLQKEHATLNSLN
nr:unnamed protein product [Naegleria fowleri]